MKTAKQIKKFIVESVEQSEQEVRKIENRKKRYIYNSAAMHRLDRMLTRTLQRIVVCNEVLKFINEK